MLEHGLRLLLRKPHEQRGGSAWLELRHDARGGLLGQLFQRLRGEARRRFREHPGRDALVQRIEERRTRGSVHGLEQASDLDRVLLCIPAASAMSALIPRRPGAAARRSRVPKSAWTLIRKLARGTASSPSSTSKMTAVSVMRAIRLDAVEPYGLPT